MGYVYATRFGAEDLWGYYVIVFITWCFLYVMSLCNGYPDDGNRLLLGCRIYALRFGTGVFLCYAGAVVLMPLLWISMDT